MVVLRYFRDGGHGHTQNSVRLFFRAAEKIVRLNSYARPVRVVLNSDGFNKPGKRAPFTTRIEFTADNQQNVYVVLLSGTQCGYGGEGPHGTATILRFLGVPEKVVNEVFVRKEMSIDWSVKENAWDYVPQALH